MICLLAFPELSFGEDFGNLLMTVPSYLGIYPNVDLRKPHLPPAPLHYDPARTGELI